VSQKERDAFWACPDWVRDFYGENDRWPTGQEIAKEAARRYPDAPQPGAAPVWLGYCSNGHAHYRHETKCDICGCPVDEADPREAAPVGAHKVVGWRCSIHGSRYTNKPEQHFTIAGNSCTGPFEQVEEVAAPVAKTRRWRCKDCGREIREDEVGHDKDGLWHWNERPGKQCGGPVEEVSEGN